jgi:predicted nuclease of predicted toxin-antitoxin system
MQAVRFLIDAQLPPALARALVEAGQSAEHVGDVGLLDADDEAIWQHAHATGATIMTKDEDFIARQRRGPEHVRIVWIRVGNTTRRALLRRFLPLLPQVLSALGAGETLIEIR